MTPQGKRIFDIACMAATTQAFSTTMQRYITIETPFGDCQLIVDCYFKGTAGLPVTLDDCRLAIDNVVPVFDDDDTDEYKNDINSFLLTDEANDLITDKIQKAL